MESLHNFENTASLEDMRRKLKEDYPGLEKLSREELERFLQGEIDPAFRPFVQRLLKIQ